MNQSTSLNLTSVDCCYILTTSTYNLHSCRLYCHRKISCVVMERDSRFSPLTNYPQLFRYVSQTAIQCFSAVGIYLVAGRSCVYWSFCFGGCGSACCAHLFSCAHISSNGYLHLLVHIGKVIAVIDYRWHCYRMGIKTDMLLLSRCRWEHNNMIGRRRCVKKKIFCVVD